MPDVGAPGAAVLNLGFLRNGVAELDAAAAIEAEVGLFVPLVRGVGVRRAPGLEMLYGGAVGAFGRGGAEAAGRGERGNTGKGRRAHA